MARRKRKKRGYLVALLISFEEQIIHLWKVYSHSIRFYKQMKLRRKWKYASDKLKYHYYEDLVDVIRPLVREQGLKSILLADLPKKDYASSFLDHVQKHHRWLVRSRRDNQVSFGQIEGVARDLKQAKYLINKESTEETLDKTTTQEADLIIKQLEKAINMENKNLKVLYGLKEIEDFIYHGGKKDLTAGEKLDYLILTENFLNNHWQKNRLHRLMQIARNKGIMTKIFAEESSSADRIDQFGGILCFKKADFS